MLKTLAEIVAEARTGLPACLPACLHCLDAATALSEMKDNDGSIVDVRELVEVNNLAAPQSLHIPGGILEMKIAEVIPEENHPIYLHCASGGRATLAAQQLRTTPRRLW